MQAFATSFREMVNERRLRSIEYSKSTGNHSSATILQQAGTTERQCTDSRLRVKLYF